MGGRNLASKFRDHPFSAYAKFSEKLSYTKNKIIRIYENMQNVL